MTPEERAEVRNFASVIGAYLRDYPELNRLIEGVEHSDRMIEWAIIDTLDDFNATPPPISFSIREIPKSILKLGVVANLLQSLVFLDVRNGLAYQEGDVSVSLEKTPQLMNLVQLLQQQYEQKKLRWKVAQNISRCWNSVHSEYWWLSGYWGGL